MGTGRENEDEDGNEVEKEKEVVQVTVGNKGVGRGKENISLKAFLSFLVYVILCYFDVFSCHFVSV